ncbi:Ger(x)C family spore germination protein [Geobacillus sp. FSL K6-3411]|uniref:Ger(x)C family spore germination protein n=1 Tax=Geobacillus sp. FSL K6-3411 TaxID=2954614 RepID=UPI0030DC0FA4
MSMRTALLIGVTVVLLCGCVRKEILDDINIESAVGFDEAGKEKIRGTIVIPVYKRGETANKTLTTVSSTAKDVLEELQYKTSEPLVSGSIEIALYGKQLAKQGIFPFIDQFRRDASIGTRLYLAVVDGTAKHLLEGNYGRQGNGIYLSNLLKQNIERRDLPKTNLHLFLKTYYADGKDPFLPYIRRVGEDVQVIGVVLFRGDRVVDTIGQSDMFYFKIVADGYSEGTHTVRLNNKKYVSIKNISTKRTISFSGPKTRPHIHVHIALEGIVREYKHGPFTSAVRRSVEKTFEQQIRSQTEALLRRFQEKQIDPIGFGDLAASRYRQFRHRDFYKHYSQLPIRITADVTIRNTGIIE